MRRALLLAAVALLAGAARARGAGAADLALGHAVAERFCYACHDRLERPGHNPLVQRLDAARFGSPERADAAVGRLEQLNAAMTLPFRGTDEERRALAAWLADVAQRGEAARRAQFRWAMALVGAAALAAVGLFTWSQRRDR